MNARSDEERRKIIEKVRKLAAIANPDSNAFEGEMENAAKLISKLMDDYTISWGEVHAVEAAEREAEARSEFIAMEAENEIRGIMQWHWELAFLIAKVTHTKAYGQTNRKGTNGHMVFFGPDLNATVATSLFVEWASIIERMAVNAYSAKFKALRKKYGRGDGMMDRVPEHERLTHFKPSFIQGVVDGMEEAVRRAERERDRKATMALMVINTQLNARYAELSKGFREGKMKRPAHFDPLAYTAGKRVGENIDITLKRVERDNPQPEPEQPKALKSGKTLRTYKGEAIEWEGDGEYLRNGLTNTWHKCSVHSELFTPITEKELED